MSFSQTCLSITLLIAFSAVAVAQPEVRPAVFGTANIAQLPNIANVPNAPKHNQVVVEFPGHRYSLEIAVKSIKEMVNGEEQTIQTVFAFVSDTHFEPLVVDSSQIRLNFAVDRRPKSFILLPVQAEEYAARMGTPRDLPRQSVFELQDPELITLISDGWQGVAQASMQVGRTPFTARLMEAKDFVPHTCNH